MKCSSLMITKTELKSINYLIIFLLFILCSVFGCKKNNLPDDENKKSDFINDITEKSESTYIGNNKTEQNINEHKVYAVYMQKMLRKDIPCFDSVDRVAMRFSGDFHEDFKKEIKQAQLAGIDGFLVDMVPCRKEADLKDFDAMYNVAKGMNFKLIPMLDTPGGVSQNKVQVADFIKGFLSRFPSATDLVHGKPLFFSYNTPFFTSEEWSYIFDSLNKDGYSICYLANMRFLNKPDKIVREMCDEYIPVGFGGLFNFYPTGGIKSYKKSILFHRMILDSFDKNLKLAASVNSWFWRASVGLFIYYPGTKHYREMWQGLPIEKLDYVSISTWNDFSENHQVQPSLYLGHTKLDLTRYYSDKLKGVQYETRKNRSVYVTYQHSLLAGEILNVEVLNLPNNADDYSVYLKLCDKNGNVLLTRESKMFSAGELQAELFDVATASIANDKRLLDLYLGVKSSKNKVTNLHYKRIGTIVVEPIINRDFRKISKSLDDIPEFNKLSFTLEGGKDSSGVYIKDKIKSAALEVKNDKKIKYIDLRRNRLDVLQHAKAGNKQCTIKLSLMSTRKYSDNNTAVRTPWEIGLNVTNAIISGLEYLSVDSRKSTKIKNKTNTSISFSSSTDALIYPISLGISFQAKTNSVFAVLFNGEEYTFTLEQLKQQRILEFVLKNKKQRVDIELVDVVSETHVGVVDNNEYKKTYNHDKLLQKYPVDYYYCRIFMDDERRSWIDTKSVLVRCSNSNMEKKNAFDTLSRKIFKVDVYPEETLIGHWQFDKKADMGSIVYDSSYYHFDGRYRGGVIGGPGEELCYSPRYTNGISGNALSFNGKNDYVILPARITPSGSFGLELWVKPQCLGKKQTLFANKRFNGHHGSIMLRINTDGMLEGLHKSSADTKDKWDRVLVDKKLRIGVWSYIALDYDGKKLSMFVNGILEAEIECSGIGLPAVPIIGADFGSGSRVLNNYFCGDLDEIKLWGVSKPDSYYKQEYKRICELAWNKNM